MESRTDTLLVRQHERVACNLAVLVRAADEHQSRIRLARTMGDGSGTIQATVIDCSHGGIGITSNIFFPKRALLKVWIVAEGDGAPILFDEIVRVQRTAMISREPRYYLGTAFERAIAPESVARLLQYASRTAGASVTEGAPRAQ